MRAKKLIGIAMAMTLFASAAGCGSSSAPAADTAPQGNEAQQEAAESPADKAQDGAAAAENEGGEAAEGGAAEAATEPAAETASGSDEASGSLSAGIPQLQYTTEYIYDADESGKYDETLCEGRIETIMLTDESKAAFPELDGALTGFISDRVKEASDARTEYSGSNKEYRESITADETDPFIYSAWVYYENYVRRLDSKCLSLLTCLDTYAGGAHGYAGYTSMNLDVATGDEIPLSDVISDESGFTEALTKTLITNYEEDAFFLSESDTDLKSMMERYVKNTVHPDQATPDEYGTVGHFEWTLDTEGLTVMFNAYDIAAYAYGTITALIPYSSGLINDAYVPADDCSIMTRIPKYMNVYADTNSDGAVESYTFYDIADEQNAGDSDGLVVTGKNGDKKVEDYFSGYDVYLVRAEGSHFILADLHGMSDWHHICTFKLEDGNVADAVTIDADAMGGYFDEAADEYYNICPTNSKALLLGNRMDLLSTYDGYKTYMIGADGNATSNDPFYSIKASYVLTSVKPIDCELVDEAGSTQGKETVPEGSNYSFVRTDGSSFVDMKLDDGRMVRIALEKDTENWGYKIGGVNAEDLFEMLYYAS